MPQVPPKPGAPTATDPKANQQQQLQPTGQGTGTVGTQPPATPTAPAKAAGNGTDPNAQAVGKPNDPAAPPPGSPQAAQQDQEKQKQGQDQINQLQQTLDALKKSLGQTA
jgi:hypothetical protein